MKRTLGSLAELVGGQARGNSDRSLQRVRTLSEAESEDLSFLTNSKYLEAAVASRAGAIMAPPSAAERLSQDLILVEDVSAALATVLGEFEARVASTPGVHPTAVVATDARIDEGATVGPLCVIGRGSSVSHGAVLESHVIVGEDCSIGEDARLMAGVTLYDRSVVGARCILHSGVVVGGDGFGYATVDGVHRKLAHLGRAVLEEDVEVGANSTIDRGLVGDTRIGAGTKIDDLVMVAHNVEIGRGCLLVAQAGIAGSARLGDGVVVAGQSGIIGHVKIGDGVVVATKSAVLGPVEAGRRVAGIPAIDLASWRRQQAVTRRLPEFRTRLLDLERKAGGAEGEEEE